MIKINLFNVYHGTDAERIDNTGWEEGDGYFSTDTQENWRYQGGDWVLLGASVKQIVVGEDGNPVTYDGEVVWA